MVFGLRINVIVSVVLFIVALVVFFKLPRGQETPAEVDPARNGPKALDESQESH